jgi:hypothetical protein
MSKKLYVRGVPVVAALAFLAIQAASASAATPEYMNCVRHAGGNYEKGCVTKSAPGKGKYELEAVTPGTAITGKSKASTIGIKSAFGETLQAVSCKKDTSTGEITSATYDDETITFEKCAGLGGKRDDSCGNLAAGTIETEPLGSELSYLPGETTIGVRLSHFGGPIASFTCGTEAITLEGSVIGRVENTNKGEEITFAVSGGKQEERFLESSGVESGPFFLYTEGEEAREATLETVEQQTGPGAY